MQALNDYQGASLWDGGIVYSLKICRKTGYAGTQKATEATMLTMVFDLYTVDEDIDGDGTIDKIYLSMSELA